MDQERPNTKVIDLCHVFIFIGNFYQDFVACDIVNMDKCHILLERLWQHDVDATYKEKKNIYMFIWKGKIVAMMPISPIPRSTREKTSSLVPLCNQFDRNAKMNPFEEGGTNVGRQSHKLKLNQGPSSNFGQP